MTYLQLNRCRPDKAAKTGRLLSKGVSSNTKPGCESCHSRQNNNDDTLAVACVIAFTPDEIDMLDLLVRDTGNRKTPTGTLGLYIVNFARLGGYLARARDPPPGFIVIWRGLSRLGDIRLGADAKSSRNVGN